MSVIAYNLGNLWRRLALPKKIRNWSLTSLQQRSPRRDRRTAGPASRDARYYWLLLAEGHLTRQRFGPALREEGSRGCRCRTASETGERAILRAKKWSGRITVSGEAGWGGQNPQSDSAERPKRAALPPQRGQGDLRLTRHGRSHRFLGEGEAENENSG